MRLPEDTARSWLGKADGEGDPFDRFVSLWFALNALYNEFFDRSERAAIGDFLYSGHHSMGEDAELAILGSGPARYFTERVIRDCRGWGTDTREDATILASSERMPTRRVKSLLMILYQVRCNLFHGNKVYARESDEEVVAHAADALGAILRACLGDA